LRDCASRMWISRVRRPIGISIPQRERRRIRTRAQKINRRKSRRPHCSAGRNRKS